MTRTLLRTAFLLSAVALLAQGGDSSRSGAVPRRGEEKPVRSASESATVERGPSAAELRRIRAARLEATLAELERKRSVVAREIADIRARRDSVDRIQRSLLAEHAEVARALLKQQLMTPSASVLLLPAEHRRLALKERLFRRYAAGQRARASKIAAAGRLLARQDQLLREREQQQRLLVDRKRAEISAVLAEGEEKPTTPPGGATGED